MSTFSIGDHDFLLDGVPHRILSGAIHYFRVHPDDWAHRIREARLMGLNTIETYVAWNEHAPQRGRFDLTGRLDLGRFLDIVADEGLHAIVRPGPYICAEFDNGGLPVWLTRDRAVRLRQTNGPYLEAVREYLEQLSDVLVPRQVEHGGPIILVQVENEYGAYGSDHGYVRRLAALLRDAGITVALTTIDQPTDEMLRAGGVPELHKTGSFGSNVAQRLAILRRHQPTGPLMCGEFWDGWFDSWGTRHHTTSAERAAAELDALLATGASVNIYMFHGGTNFGLTNGANHKGRYLPISTSYDYDAPLDEAGRRTEKYRAFREVIAKHAPVPAEEPIPDEPPPALDVPLVQRGPLPPGAFGPAVHTASVPTFDDVGHDRGYGLYRTLLEGCAGPAVLEAAEVRDRAWVRLDGRFVGTLAREAHERTLLLPSGTGMLELLVEDQGRVNYGPRLGEAKGLIGDVLLDGRPLRGWSLAVLDPGAARRGPSDEPPSGAPESGEHPQCGPFGEVARAVFELADRTHLFLDTSGWGKGLAWMNDFALGRYWRRGPQQTLFVPRGATRRGRNTLTVLEFEVIGAPVARFVSAPQLGPQDE